MIWQNVGKEWMTEILKIMTALQVLAYGHSVEGKTSHGKPSLKVVAEIGTSQAKVYWKKKVRNVCICFIFPGTKMSQFHIYNIYIPQSNLKTRTSINYSSLLYSLALQCKLTKEFVIFFYFFIFIRQKKSNVHFMKKVSSLNIFALLKSPCTMYNVHIFECS